VSRPDDALPGPLPIPTLTRAFDALIRPPGSKSLTNRALLLAALAEGTSTLRGPLIDADDAAVMIRALEQLGAMIERSSDARGPLLKVAGVRGRWEIPDGQTVRLDLDNAGTATRFLVAAALLSPPGSSVIIDGSARMRQRPIAELVDVLRGVVDSDDAVEYLGEEGFPPIRVSPGLHPWPPCMTSISFGRTQSSQFISAMLLIAPFIEGGMLASLPREPGGITSEPYIDMTLGLLSHLGVVVERDHPSHSAAHGRPNDRTIRIGFPRRRSGPGLDAFDLDIEPDASGATYFQAAAALIPGASVVIDALPADASRSLQGDAGFSRVLAAMGATVSSSPQGWSRITGPRRLAGVDFDLADMPDTAMTAAVLACFADGPTTLRGLRTLRVKETDRLEALKIELTRIGARVEIIPDHHRGHDDEALRITPPPHMGTNPVTFHTYKDHRMAMALALIGLRRSGVFIADPGCVAKTYPGYWADLERVRTA
jgi:3-phosphoshikimate 1-carboxyvinyltransferase